MRVATGEDDIQMSCDNSCKSRQPATYASGMAIRERGTSSGVSHN